MVYNTKRGFTLIEAIMVIAIIAILSVSGTYLLIGLVQNSVFIPHKMNMDMLASEALDIMIEGDARARGLRYSRAMANISDNQLNFTNTDTQSVRFRLDTVAHNIYRSINGSAETPIPYYAVAGINITGKNNKLFSYYDINGLETTNPLNVRRIKLSLTAMTGSGSYTDWQAQSEQVSSIAVDRFQ